MILHDAVAFLTSREFTVNFFANLGGAMIGVFLAFWFERVRARREARMLYGRILQTSHSELG
jgi:membrane associated rhomboid family serine protease